jgi:hypothetical protein
MIGGSSIFESFWLLAVNNFIESTVEKSVFNIQLMDWPVGRNGDGENKTYGGWFNDGAECFFIVDALLLAETAYDPSSFIAGEGPIGVVLVTINPFTANNVGAGWRLDEFPCVIKNEGIKFSAHCLSPIWILESRATIYSYNLPYMHVDDAHSLVKQCQFNLVTETLKQCQLRFNEQKQCQYANFFLEERTLSIDFIQEIYET